MTPKKHFAKSTTAVEGFAHVVNDLKIDVPKAAAELEKNPPPLVQAATSQQTPAAPPPAGGPPTPQQHLKGVVFSKLGLAGTHYEQALDTVLSDIEWAPLGPKVKFDRADSKHWDLLGVKDLKDFAAKTQRALTQDPTHAVTPETGVGNYFEIVGWDLPQTKFLVTTTFHYLRDDVYAAAGVEGALRNGLNQPIKLQSHFTGPLQTMENTHIFYVENGREVHGGKFVDAWGHRVVMRSMDAWPRCDEPLSTIQKTRLALAYGSVFMACSTSLPNGAIPVVGSPRPNTLPRCTSQAAR